MRGSESPSFIPRPAPPAGQEQPPAWGCPCGRQPTQGVCWASLWTPLRTVPAGTGGGQNRRVG